MDSSGSRHYLSACFFIRTAWTQSERCQVEKWSEKGKLIVPIVLNSGPGRDLQEGRSDVEGPFVLPYRGE